MTAVAAAIAAAFLAGFVALFREHRLQQRQLLVASRVTEAACRVAADGLRTSLETNRWAPFNLLPGEASFSKTWESHKGDLAGHLTWQEWRHVEQAVNHYLAVGMMGQDEPPEASRLTLTATIDLLVKGGETLNPYSVQRLSVWKLLQRRLPESKSA
jgi:hypothetical protein